MPAEKNPETKIETENNTKPIEQNKSGKKISGAKIIVYLLILLVGAFIGVYSSFLPFCKITTVLQLKTGMYESHYTYFGFISGGTKEKESVFKQLTDGSVDKKILISTEKQYLFGEPETEYETLGYYASQFDGLWTYPEYDYKPKMLELKKVIIKAFASGNQATVNQLSSTFTQDAQGFQIQN